MKITLAEGRKMVASRVKECANFDTARLDELIYLGIYASWRSGEWYGCQRYIDCKVADGLLVLPPDYGTLLGLNINRRPARIHSDWYQFSPNGPGSMTCKAEDCEMRGEVFDMQEVPTVFPVWQGEKLLVVPRHAEDMGTKVCIQGINSDGNPIQRYYTTIKGSERINESGPGEVVELGLNQPVQTFNAFALRGISSIKKPRTIGPVEIYAMRNGSAVFLTRMEPWQRDSTLRAYRLPHPCCNYSCLQALVKLNEPKMYDHDDDILQIENPEALIHLVMHKYHELETKELNYATYFFNKAMESLNGQLRSKRGGIISSIKVHGLGYARNTKTSPLSY